MSEWASVRLGELACRICSKNTTGNDNVLTISARQGLVGQERYFNKRVASQNLSNYFLLQRGDFAYNKSYSNGYPLGAIKRLERHDTGVVSPLYICFRIQATERVASDYLMYFFESGAFNEHLRAIAREGARNHGLLNVKPSEFFELPVTLPPLPEQRKIAAILTAVDETIEKTEAVIEKLGIVKNAMMQELLTRGLPGRHTRFKKTEIGEIPEAWEVVPVEVACLTVIDCKNRTPPYAPEGYAVVRTPNVRHGRLVRTDLRRTDAASYREWTKRGVPRPGDVLITREAPYGEVCLVPEDEPVCLGQRMMLYRPNPERIMSSFLLEVIQSSGVQDWLRLQAGGSTVGHVRVGDIRRLPIPIPTRGEQEVIAAVGNALSKREDAERAVHEALQSLKSALMSVLLTGELRVSTEPG